MRLAAPFVAGLVMRDQRHGDLGAGPGVLAQIVDGLAAAVARARLRQRQPHDGRLEQRMRGGGAGFRVRVLEGEIRLRVDHAVIVLQLVVEPQRAARLRLRRLEQRDGRRPIGNGGESPGEIAAADAAQARAAVALDDEAAFGGTLGQRLLRIGLGGLQVALRRDVETHVAGRAHHQLAAGRHRYRGLVARALARAQARQHQRRAAGIDRRSDPGIDAEIGRLHDAMPVEGGGDAFHALAAGGEEAGGRQDEHQRAQRHWVAQRQPRMRPAGLEPARGEQRALDMGLPERLRDRVVLIGGDAVGDRGGRPVALAADAVEPAQALAHARQAQQHQRRRRHHRHDNENAQPYRPPKRRQGEPEAGPGEGQEQAERGRQQSERRPQAFPQQAAARALERPRQQHSGGRPAFFRLFVQRVQEPLRRPGLGLELTQHASTGLFPKPCSCSHRRTVQAGMQKERQTLGRIDGGTTRCFRMARIPICRKSRATGPNSTPHSQGGRRSRAMSRSTSIRGRITAHSASLTSTSGTSGRVL